MTRKCSAERDRGAQYGAEIARRRHRALLRRALRPISAPLWVLPANRRLSCLLSVKNVWARLYLSRNRPFQGSKENLKKIAHN